MKKFYALLLFTGVFASAKAQSVDLTWAADSSDYGALCDGSGLPVYFFIQANAAGYTVTDVPTITIDFGDGTSTTFLDPSFSSTYPYSFTSAEHIYTAPGSYDVTYTITMPDLVSDQVIMYNEVLISPCDIISGYVFDDNNTNCLNDGGDVLFSGMGVVATDPLTNYFYGYTSTDANGYYELYLPTGVAYNISLMSGTSLVYNCPSTGIINASAPAAGNNFAVDCDASFDLEPISMGGFLHPGFTEEVRFSVLNYGCYIGPDATISIVLDNPLVTFVSGIAAGGDNTPTISGNTYTWDIPAAFINNYSMYIGYGIDLTLELHTDPSVPLGTPLCFDVTAGPEVGDVNTANNTQSLCFPVANAWDPNYIEAIPCGIGAAGYIENNQKMTYTVHFQNTGNFPATNVLIKDTLDGAVLDLTSFEFIASSHSVTGIIASTDGAMVFKFDGINLPDSTNDEPNSHGWITYSIDQQPNLVPTTTIENTAAIYFDFNEPVITNTALNTITNSLVLPEAKGNENYLHIYPVPANNQLTVLTNAAANSAYQVIDLNGQLMLEGSVSNGEQISIEGLTNGIYFFRLESGEIEKLIINK